MAYNQEVDNPLSLLIPQNYKRKILCIARITSPKRFDLFLEIALLLKEYAFIWIGNNNIVENTPGNVFMLGNIPGAKEYNRYVDLFILPSSYEGLPIVIIEAMSFEKPIVASNVGGISEIVINNENGYVVENTAKSFAEKIRFILENEDVYNKFASNSLRIYKENLTLDKMVKKYIEVYEA